MTLRVDNALRRHKRFELLYVVLRRVVDVSMVILCLRSALSTLNVITSRRLQCAKCVRRLLRKTIQKVLLNSQVSLTQLKSVRRNQPT
jgi:hypothetical protein